MNTFIEDKKIIFTFFSFIYRSEKCTNLPDRCHPLSERDLFNQFDQSAQGQSKEYKTQKNNFCKGPYSLLYVPEKIRLYRNGIKVLFFL
jgi:hypothetical protein